MEGFIGQTLTGTQFNKYFADRKFVKLTIESENHNGFQFKTGLNIDTIKFNPIDECLPGGIYFCEFNLMHLWVDYSKDICVNYREVTIPNDAQVYVETAKLKADKLILGEKQDLWTIEELCEAAVMRNGYHLKYVQKQTPKICELAVTKKGDALYYVEEQTENLCKIAVSNYPTAIKHVKIQTEELCEIAVIQNGMTLEFVKSQTEKICELAVTNKGDALQFVKDQTEKICALAVSQNGYVIAIVKDKTERLCELAVSQCGFALKHIKQQTDQLCKLAIRQNIYAHEYIIDPIMRIRVLAAHSVSINKDAKTQRFTSKYFLSPQPE